MTERNSRRSAAPASRIAVRGAATAVAAILLAAGLAGCGDPDGGGGGYVAQQAVSSGRHGLITA